MTSEAANARFPKRWLGLGKIELDALRASFDEGQRHALAEMGAHDRGVAAKALEDAADELAKMTRDHYGEADWDVINDFSSDVFARFMDQAALLRENSA